MGTRKGRGGLGVEVSLSRRDWCERVAPGEGVNELVVGRLDGRSRVVLGLGTTNKYK